MRAREFTRKKKPEHQELDELSFLDLLAPKIVLATELDMPGAKHVATGMQ